MKETGGIIPTKTLGPEGNLPEWPGASAVYSKAYRVLENMARHGHAKPASGYWHGKHWIQNCAGSVSTEMSRMIDALGEGNEETIKGLLLMDWVYF